MRAETAPVPLVSPLAADHRRLNDHPVLKDEGARLEEISGALSQMSRELREKITVNAESSSDTDSSSDVKHVKNVELHPNYGARAYSAENPPPLKEEAARAEGAESRTEKASRIVFNHVVKQLRGMTMDELKTSLAEIIYNDAMSFDDIDFSKMPIGWENTSKEAMDNSKGEHADPDNLREHFFYELLRRAEELVMEYLDVHLNVIVEYTAKGGGKKRVGLFKHCTFNMNFDYNDNFSPTKAFMTGCLNTKDELDNATGIEIVELEWLD
jgi:hypothetical protein